MKESQHVFKTLAEISRLTGAHSPSLAETIKQAMDDWDNATDEQRADALARAAALAKLNETNHCATCGHYREWHMCLAPDLGKPAKAADTACELYTTERASDLIDDGYGIRARGGLVYFG